MNTRLLEEWLKKLSPESLFPVVPFDAKKDVLVKLDFTDRNTSLTAEIFEDTNLFSTYIAQQLATKNALYGIGGYNENRMLYSRSEVFDGKAGESPRRVHLGIDIWGEAGTPVFAPIDGTIHSFAFNNQYGDYGATIILEHDIGNLRFYSLYGHLSLKDLEGLKEKSPIKGGALIAHFGEPAENGHWPPHLHFQLMFCMDGMRCDYPGVCTIKERNRYLQNCPDPDLILQMLPQAVPIF
jgi:peptidoglycan LD-endopeptidase LytH